MCVGVYVRRLLPEFEARRQQASTTFDPSRARQRHARKWLSIAAHQRYHRRRCIVGRRITVTQREDHQCGASTSVAARADVPGAPRIHVNAPRMGTRRSLFHVKRPHSGKSSATPPVQRALAQNVGASRAQLSGRASRARKDPTDVMVTGVSASVSRATDPTGLRSWARTELRAPAPTPGRAITCLDSRSVAGVLAEAHLHRRRRGNNLGDAHPDTCTSAL